MKSTRSLRSIALACLAWAFGGQLSAAPGGGEMPNILFIHTDEQGYGDLGVHDHPLLKTPNLDTGGHIVLHERGELARFFGVETAPEPIRERLGWVRTIAS
ncbi:hypothetical protein [Luteolibacter sp. AS25]|uniref:hypothetical protein n=1 Tax=Luteolibacter sp. AS25 TaxID=3135776 RepID=UPI00398A73D3